MAKKYTLTTTVAKEVAALTGRGTVISTDRLSDGRRNLRVMGWMCNDYKKAIALLEKVGCKVEPVMRKQFWFVGKHKISSIRVLENV